MSAIKEIAVLVLPPSIALASAVMGLCEQERAIIDRDRLVAHSRASPPDGFLIFVHDAAITTARKRTSCGNPYYTPPPPPSCRRQSLPLCATNCRLVPSTTLWDLPAGYCWRLPCW